MLQRPSLKTVARAAGVSPSTVSNAYNRPDHLSPEMRARVFAIARQLGYAGPDAAARTLRSRRAGAIGVLFTAQLSYAFSDPYCVELLTGVAEVAERSRTSVVLMPLAPVDAAAESPYGEHESVESVRRAVVDGAIADGIGDDHPAIRVLDSRGLPIARSVDGDTGRRVVIDETAAAITIGEHVWGLGHRHVAVVVESPVEGPVESRVGDPDAGHVDEDALHPYARLRLAGIRAGLGDAASVVARAASANSLDAGRRAAERLLAGRQRPTAIVATSDVLALGVLAAARAAGLRPGRDVSVTGFDDIPAAAGAGLTTIRQPVRDKGRLMARMLLDPSFEKEKVVLPTVLVTRDSTGPAPRSGRSRRSTRTERTNDA